MKSEASNVHACAITAISTLAPNDSCISILRELRAKDVSEELRTTEAKNWYNYYEEELRCCWHHALELMNNLLRNYVNAPYELYTITAEEFVYDSLNNRPLFNILMESASRPVWLDWK